MLIKKTSIINLKFFLSEIFVWFKRWCVILHVSFFLFYICSMQVQLKARERCVMDDLFHSSFVCCRWSGRILTKPGGGLVYQKNPPQYSPLTPQLASSPRPSHLPVQGNHSCLENIQFSTYLDEVLRFLWIVWLFLIFVIAEAQSACAFCVIYWGLTYSKLMFLLWPQLS